MNQLNYENKQRKGLIAATLLTIMALVSTVVVAAVLLGTFTGGEVTVGGVASSAVNYSSDNVEANPWTTTLNPSGASSPWYSRLEISAGDYSGPVTITWQLEQKTGPSTWVDVSGASATTTMTLAGTAENVYATSDGTYGAGNNDWGSDVTAAGTYRVVATVESA